MAYSAFANEGRRPTQMHLITKIIDPNGKTVFESSAAKSEPVQATDPYTAWQIHSCLRQSIEEGPGALVTKKYGLANVPVAGKTGTHSNFTDTWFVGYSNRVTCAVWAGLDRPSMIYENAFSRDIALPIWAAFMKSTLNDYPVTEIASPKEAQILEICSHSGLRATDACYETKPDPSANGRLVYARSTYQEIVRPGYRVTQNCDVHSKRPDGSNASASTDSLLLRAPTSTAGLNPALANAIGVPISSPVVLGGYDPYDSAKPVLKTKRVKVTDIGDDAIMREPQFDLTPTIQIDQEKSRINLRPPDTLRIPLE
jgi:membrane carboxypeptidase/penicillin-binding protein